MRQCHPRRGGAVAVLTLVVVATLVGAGPARKRAQGIPPKADETVSDVAIFHRAGDIKVEGVGLVVGLDNTGSDPPPSWYRTKLLDEMRKAGVERAEKILAMKSTSVVLVKAQIPIGYGPKDPIDLEIELPPGSATTSLAGGQLMRTRLSEVLRTGDGSHEGEILAYGDGPIMTGTPKAPDNLKAGRVLGGGRTKKEFPYILEIRERRQSVRTAAILMAAINQRFHQHEGVDEVGVVSAKTKLPDRYLTVKVPPVYHKNQFRYFRVINLIPIVDTPELREQRLQTWGRQLLDPKTAGVSALRLEALGPGSVPTLKKGLASPDPQVRFFAAEALAYLNDGSGAEELGAAVVGSPAFRAYALAALSAMDQPAAFVQLRKLMGAPDLSVRYGAFDALRSLDPYDPFLGRMPVLRPAPEPPASDAMAVSIANGGGRSRKARRPEDPFELYVVDCDGPPLVHVSTTRRREIVLFGADQKLLTPAVLGGSGDVLLNAADGDESVQISRIGSADGAIPDRKVNSPLELGTVLREAANLGATYPEMIELLRAAHKQRNLPGPLAFDLVPQPDPKYLDALVASANAAKKDEAIQKTKMETSRTRRFLDRLRSRFGR